MNGMVGQKVGMTRVYSDDGKSTPVTVILAEPNIVTQIKEEGGRKSAQLGVGSKRGKKPQVAHFKKANTDVKAFVREFALDKDEAVELGQQITVSRFQAGQFVDVIGVSKGKGFQGVMKKHNFQGQGDAHGSTTHRRNGAIGCRSTPGRIFKNLGMPGHMGDKRVTVQNLKVVQVRTDDHVLLVRGAVPGAKGSYLIVRDAVKKKKTPKA